MKKITINYILWYFSRFNKELYIEYDKLFDIIYFYNRELREVFETLERIEKHFTIKDINNWYFMQYFTYNYFGTHTRVFNLTNFLEYATKELPSFRDDIINELKK